MSDTRQLDVCEHFSLANDKATEQKVFITMAGKAGFVAVHAGAGFHSRSNREDYKATVRRACLKGLELLEAGSNVVEVAAQAGAVLEDCPLTNAGKGSCLTLDGGVEGDACIMEGTSMLYGAVGAVPNVRNPVIVAQKLLEYQRPGLLSLGRIPPNTLVGEGARKWAADNGLADQLCDHQSLVTENSRRIFQKYIAKLADKNGQRAAKKAKLDVQEGQDIGDTVGVVCVDHQGNIACAASSGGILLKHPGRLGQAAIYGSGCWAENSGKAGVAVCTSGSGEHIIKTLFARQCALSLQSTDDPTAALSNTANKHFLESPILHGVSEKFGGVLALKTDATERLDVEVLWAHSTPTMCLAYSTTTDSKPHVLLSELPTDIVPGSKFIIGSKQFYLTS